MIYTLFLLNMRNYCSWVKFFDFSHILVIAESSSRFRPPSIRPYLVESFKAEPNSNSDFCKPNNLAYSTGIPWQAFTVDRNLIQFAT